MLGPQDGTNLRGLGVSVVGKGTFLGVWSQAAKSAEVTRAYKAVPVVLVGLAEGHQTRHDPMARNACHEGSSVKPTKS